jgi:hypothetical protein
VDKLEVVLVDRHLVVELGILIRLEAVGKRKYFREVALGERLGLDC